MTDHNAFDDRRRALEESFFQQQNAALADKLRAQKQAQEAKRVLAELSGVRDERLLDELVGVGVTAESIAALTLYPLVAVAWADGRLEAKEKTAVLRAAHEQGVAEGTPAHALLESWLAAAPGAALKQAWSDYVKALKGKLDAAHWAQLRESVLSRCSDVAHATGGLLGIGALSGEEKAAIAEITAALS